VKQPTPPRTWRVRLGKRHLRLGMCKPFGPWDKKHMRCNSPWHWTKIGTWMTRDEARELARRYADLGARAAQQKRKSDG